MRDALIALLAGRQGHFRMESGYHSERWFELDRLFDHPETLAPFVAELARRLAAHGVAGVCGPMTGGAKLAELVALEMGHAYFFTERLERGEKSGLFPVEYIVPARFREKLRGQAIAIVDDAVSAGSAARGTYADLVACGARPVALGALFVFGDAAGKFASARGLKLEGLAQLPLGIWKPENCPLCRAGLPWENVSAQ